MAHLLVVDDDRATRTFLKLAMQRDGHQVLEAETGQDCLELACNGTYNMILLDAKMPEMDGFTCCAELKTILQDKCPPIIMITGLADKMSVDQAFAVGAIDYVTKPIHIFVLKHRIRQVLRERELMRELAVINQKLADANRELLQSARVDCLTEVSNRRYFEEILSREWGRLARQESSLGFIFCDVDFFKQYNDLYGHLAGDRCLKQICEILKLSTFRPADLVARYGGEEFVILLPETGMAGTWEVAKRIHSQLSNAAMPHAGSKITDKVTVSIGITCTVPKLTLAPTVLIDVADQALYDAKAGGRNQIVMRSL